MRLRIQGMRLLQVSPVANWRFSAKQLRTCTIGVVAALAILGLFPPSAPEGSRAIASPPQQATAPTEVPAAEGRWLQLPGGDRYQHSAVWTGTEMIIWGGSGGTGGFAYEPATDRWSMLPEEGSPSRRSGHAAVWTGTEMLIWGGGEGEVRRVSKNDGARYNPATRTWSPISAQDAPEAGGAGSAAWTGQELIVLGVGEERGGRYDPRTDRWAPITPDSPPISTIAAQVWTGSDLLVWGGIGRFPQNTRMGWRYTPTTDQWSSIAPAPVERGTAVWTGSEVIMWSGSLNGEGGRYDPLTDVWRPISMDDAPTGAASTYAVWTGREVFVCAWIGRCGLAYDPTTDRWRQLPSDQPFAIRGGSSLIFTGTEIIVFGGDVPFRNYGARYDLARGTWTQITAFHSPSPRLGHSAVWTGAEVIIWGGRDRTNKNDGARYHLADNSWTPVSLAGAPAPRSGHSATWTGRQMIVWGGGTLGDGGIYTPATNTWSPVPATSTLSARDGHAAAWTGRELVIWGGRSGQDVLSDGAALDPVSMTWRPISSVGAPRGRAGHSAVWTGREVIFWGGSGRSDGGRYDPATDTWSPLSSVNAPTGRIGHSATWSDGAMVVWGGLLPKDAASTRPPIVFLRDGGRYNPASDTWELLTERSWPPMVGALPSSERSGHTPIWTGTEMVSWGGSFLRQGPLSIGSRYLPPSTPPPHAPFPQPLSQLPVPADRGEEPALAVSLDQGVSGVALIGDYAFVGAGRQVVAVDITDPERPTNVGHSMPLAASVRGLAAVEPYLYVLVGDPPRGITWSSTMRGTLEVLDVSDPHHPQLIARYPELPLPAFVGQTAYLSSPEGLRIIDASEPSHLTEVGQSDTPLSGANVQVAGAHLVLHVRRGFQVLDVTTPAAPRSVGTSWVSLERVSSELTIVENAAFDSWVGERGAAGLRVIDLSNPSLPVEVRSLFLTYPGFRALAGAEGFIYALSRRETIIMDVRDPSRPEQVGTMSELVGMSGMVTRDARLFVGHESGFSIMDIANPAEPVEISRID
jgi:hypothetical protein